VDENIGAIEMNSPTHRIPTHDEIGQRIKIGERAILFSRHDIHYTGTVVQRGGKRWFQLDDCNRMFIGGIGNCRIMKEENNESTKTN